MYKLNLKQKRAQTATEYLIILAVVIVIALIVVGVLGGIPSIGGGANENQARAVLSSMPIGVSAYSITPYKTTLRLKNNLPESVKISGISLGGTSCRFDDLTNPSEKTYTLKMGESKNIYCINVDANSSDKYSHQVTINYTDLSNGATYTYSEDGARLVGTAGSANCPTGYIPVPGSETYGTSDFCVMKYEAKAELDSDGTIDADGQSVVLGDNFPASVAEGRPWVSISQINAKLECESIGGHLITNAEWMTIARNVEQVSSNWNGGIVGTNNMYRGHTDNSPASACEASSDDSKAYVETDCTLLASGEGEGEETTQRRTLTLSNGEVIWDFAGNVWDWTDGEINCAVDDCDSSEMPIDINGYGDTSSNWAQYDEIVSWGAVSRTLIAPSNSSWDSNYGVGRPYLDFDAAAGSPTTTHAFPRGGDWNNGASAGAFSLGLAGAPSYSPTGIGFRCVVS